MKKLLWILKVILLLPVLPLIGIPEADGGTDGEQDPPPGDEGTEGGEDEEDEPLTVTRDELDALVKKEARKIAREAAKKKPGAKEADPPAEDDAAAKAEKKLAAANEKLLKGTVKSLAPDMEMTAKGAEAALRLADFSGCFDADGELDEDAVMDALEEFKEKWPEFNKLEDTPAGGTGGKGNFARRQKENNAAPKTVDEKIENKLSALFK